MEPKCAKCGESWAKLTKIWSTWATPLCETCQVEFDLWANALATFRRWKEQSARIDKCIHRTDHEHPLSYEFAEYYRLLDELKVLSDAWFASKEEKK